MGTQISANYDNIQETETVDIWKIHSAASHVSKEKVCLWVIDVPKLKEKYKKKAVRFRYLDVILNSLQQMRKYRHPRILKILEIADKKPEIGFSSEPFDKFVSKMPDLHPMDVAYISYQIAEVLSFLTNEARIAHLCLSSSAVLLDDQLSVKLTNFQWSSPMDSLGNVTPSQTYDQLFNEFSDNYVKAPEMLKKGNAKITSAADVFLFGMFVYEAFTGHKYYDSDNPDSILNSISTKHAQIKGESKIPADFLPLLSDCLEPDPDQRPNIASILQHPAYQSMQLKSLRYIDIMLTKNPSDKFAFYKGLSKKIDEFSPSIQRIKLLPTLVNECIADVRFAPILLGAIFQISVKFNTDEFMDLVWRKLSVLSTVVTPPEVSIGLLRNLWMLLEKVDKRLHKDYVYPIIFSALNSQDSRIHNEVLKHIDAVIDEMNEETLRSLILPRLFDLSINSTNISVSSSSILCISKSLKRMDNEAFCAEFIPKFVQIWRKFNNPQIATPILEVFFNLNVSLDVLMLRVLPLSCEIAANNSLDDTLRAKFCNYIIKIAQDFRDKGGNEKNFNEQENVDGGENEKNITDNDNPFATSHVAHTSSASKLASSSNNVASSLHNASPNPFANDDDDASNSFGVRTVRANSEDVFAKSGSNNKSESSKTSMFSNFDSPNPFATPSADKSKDDEDDDDGFGKRKNVFSFSSNNNSTNLPKDSFSHNDSNSNLSKESSNNPFSTSNLSKETSNNPFSISTSPKESSNNPFQIAASYKDPNRPFSTQSSSKDMFSHESSNNSRDIFGSSGSNNNSNLPRKKSDDFQADSVFSKPNQNATKPKMSSSQPFNEDIFNDKAFQETGDETFSRSPSFPPFNSSTNNSTSVFSNSSSTNPSTSVFSNSTSASSPSTSVFSNSTSASSPSTSVFSNSSSTTNPSTSVFSNSSTTANPSTSVFSNSSSTTNPSTSVFSNSSSTTNSSTSVFSNSTQNQSNSQITDFTGNLGLGPISANDIFGSSVAQTSTDNYFGSAFGQGSNSMNKPIPAPSSSANNSGMDMHATKHQLGAGGFGDFGSSFGGNSSTTSSTSHTNNSSPIVSSFGTGLDDGFGSGNNNNKSDGFRANNYSSPASMSGFPSVESNSKQSFNPFQSDNDIKPASHSGLPPAPQSHHGSGFNPFQSANGGGGGSSDGIPRVNDANSMFTTPSGRMSRNMNNSNSFQFNQGGPANLPSGAMPRKKPSQSASYDILDILG